MKFELEDFGGDGPVLHFAHANGFPPSTYRKLLGELAKRFHVVTLKSRQLHRAISPSTLVNWDVMADDLVDSLRAAGLSNVVGVGHSMGGVATLIAASRAPELFHSVMALDPVIFSRRDEALVRGTQKLGISRWFPPASAARKRREVWPSRHEAGLRYRPKPLFRDFDADCFADYLKCGFTDVGDEVWLTISRAWEARVFETGPDDVWGALKKLNVPTTFVRGRESTAFSRAAMTRVKKSVPSAQTLETPGGHLFPLEHPLECGQLVEPPDS